MEVSLEMGLLVASVLVFCSILMSKAGYRFGVPTLLVFLVGGMCFGTDGLGIQFDDASGAQRIGMVALSIILFTGGMDTRLDEIRPVWGAGAVLATLGVLLTTLFTGFFVYGISMWQHEAVMGFSLLGALLLAATMSSTDSASVFNILRSQSIRLKHNLRPLLELESGSNDPMAYLLTIVLIQCMQSGGVSAWEVVSSFVLQFVVGVVGGLLLGRLAVWVVNHVGLRNAELYSIMVLMFVFIIYCSVYLLQGNGYLAVYLAGMVMGNSRLFKKREVSRFMDGMTWLLQVVMFLILGLLVNPHEMLPVAVVSLLVGVFMIVVARPLSVWLCLLPFRRKFTLKDQVFVSWVGLRGAAPILFATYPVVAQVEGARQIFNIVFFVTMLSLLFQGMSLPWMARRLGLTEDGPDLGDNFGVEIPDDVGTALREVACTSETLAHGRHIRDLSLPAGVLVMMVRRGDRYIVPNGNVELREGDILLLISEEEQPEKQKGGKRQGEP